MLNYGDICNTLSVFFRDLPFGFLMDQISNKQVRPGPMCIQLDTKIVLADLHAQMCLKNQQGIWIWTSTCQPEAIEQFIKDRLTQSARAGHPLMPGFRTALFTALMRQHNHLSNNELMPAPTKLFLCTSIVCKSHFHYDLALRNQHLKSNIRLSRRASPISLTLWYWKRHSRRAELPLLAFRAFIPWSRDGPGVICD